MAATGFLAAGTFTPRKSPPTRPKRNATTNWTTSPATIGTTMLGPDGRLRAVPRSQIRSDSEEDYYRLIATFTTTVRSEPGRPKDRQFELSDFRLSIAPLDGKQPAVEAKLVRPRATAEHKDSPVAGAIDGDKKTAWSAGPENDKSQSAILELEKPAGFPGGSQLTFTLKFEKQPGSRAIGRPRLSISTRSGPVRFEEEDFPHELIVEGVPAVRLHTQGPDFYDQTFILKRGDLNQKQAEAPQGFLQALMRDPEQEKRWVTRRPRTRAPVEARVMAKWITDVDTPERDRCWRG
jgi:hypothetical protein